MKGRPIDNWWASRHLVTGKLHCSSKTLAFCMYWKGWSLWVWENANLKRIVHTKSLFRSSNNGTGSFHATGHQFLCNFSAIICSVLQGKSSRLFWDVTPPFTYFVRCPWGQCSRKPDQLCSHLGSFSNPSTEQKKAHNAVILTMIYVA